MRGLINNFNNFLLNEAKKVNLDKYRNVIFSEDFYKQNENMINYLKKTYLTKLEDFITFYNKYNTKGIRVIDGIDVYEESKSIFDKVINGNIPIDEVFRNPNNPLRNVILLLHIDEPNLSVK